jgi:hypothetical protein
MGSIALLYLHSKVPNKHEAVQPVVSRIEKAVGKERARDEVVM